jgi:hypothetical protein
VPIEKFYQFENLFLCKTHSIEGKDDKKSSPIKKLRKMAGEKLSTTGLWKSLLMESITLSRRKTIHFVSKLISIPTKNITEEFLGHSQPFHSV